MDSFDLILFIGNCLAMGAMIPYTLSAIKEKNKGQIIWGTSMFVGNLVFVIWGIARLGVF